MAMENISIFGSGFVGGAVYHGLSPFYNVKIYDKYKPGYNGLEETIDFSRYIFVCVPTPVNLDDNSQELCYIEDALSTIEKMQRTKKLLL